MDNKSKDMDVSQTPLPPFFEENVTEFVKSKFGRFFFFFFPEEENSPYFKQKSFPKSQTFFRLVWKYTGPQGEFSKLILQKENVVIK